MGFLLCITLQILITRGDSGSIGMNKKSPYPQLEDKDFYNSLIIKQFVTIENYPHCSNLACG
ncbi:hypothetical protein PLUA15_560069 [Pseudomonas lundensis]|uniref:Uncharacterized protein n=1 Tax=Pseudomonas lundensis TaxID=86185 RepID=A0AAX2HDZ2_9PSED|nr:hypothetical protein PLUA15_560069 [Pseudomonas lundensis]